MINRESYLKQIEPLIDKDIVKILVGFRRTGKSVLLELIKEYLVQKGRKEEQFIQLNFEDLENMQYLKMESLYQYLRERLDEIPGKAYLFLDEIQFVKGWERVINSFRASDDVDIYLTGSNAELFSAEFATYMAGRFIHFEVYPYSYKEFLAAKNLTNSQENFQGYLTTGGMPFVVSGNLEGQVKDAYLSDIYRAVILKDVIQRHDVRNIDLLERITRYALDNVGTIISGLSISKYLKNEGIAVRSDTVLNYLHYLTDAMLLYPLRKYNLKGKQRLKSLEKYYIVDHGLRESILHSNATDIQLILENVVALEAIRRGYDVQIGELGNKEIDFVIRKGNQKLYLQVTYLLSSPETIEREFSPFLSIRDNYRKVVLSLDPVLQAQQGVEHLNIYDFLFDEESW